MFLKERNFIARILHTDNFILCTYGWSLHNFRQTKAIFVITAVATSTEKKNVRDNVIILLQIKDILKRCVKVEQRELLFLKYT